MRLIVQVAAAVAVMAGLGAAGARGQQPAPGSEPVSYARQIRPILELKCYECHDEQERESGLVVTSLAGLLAGGDAAGPAIVPGRPDDSPIIGYLTGALRPRMPRNYRPLPDEQIDLFRRWIAEGAADDGGVAGVDGPSELETAGVPELLPTKGDSDRAARIETALFGEDAEGLFVLRRELRLARLPKAAPPPDAHPESDNPIDGFIAARWREAGLPEASAPPPLVDDATFLRRASLDVIGVIPEPGEVAAFVADTSPGKRAAAVDRLLARSEDYAAHWTPFWEEALGSQTTRLQGGIATRGNYREWIFRQMADNVPFDVFAASLIDPQMPRHKPSTEVAPNGKRLRIGYVLNNTPTDAIQTAANVAQVFLGTSMKCASCHNHFSNDEWPQSRFIAFAGLFTEGDLELVRCEKRTGQYVEARFPFALPGMPEAPATTEKARLHRVGLLLTDPANPRFARAIVNRLWRRYIGLGLVEPIDDFRLDRPASHPALLDWLADDFMRHGYDLKHTIRLILTSRTYQHRYDAARADVFDVQKPDEPRYFRSPRLRRLTAEQFIDSVRLVANGSLDRKQRIYLDRISTALTRALGRPASRNEISTARSEEVPVLTALELMNGPELNYLVYESPVLARAAAQTRSPADAERAIEDLYRRALGRAPRPEERRLALAYVRAGTPAGPVRVSTSVAARLERAPADVQPDEPVFDDGLPEGAVVQGSSGDASFVWVSEPGPLPSGEKAHTQAGDGEVTFHRVSGLPPINPGPHDRLVTWVYLDPAQPPYEVMVEWLAGTEWEHRAWWGDQDRADNLPDPPQRRWLGPLPKTGGWVRLEVPAGEVGLGEGVPITGWSFVQAGGRATWDAASLRRVAPDPRAQAFGDLLWALLASPEFQFVH